jgi:hypothetical protein
MGFANQLKAGILLALTVETLCASIFLHWQPYPAALCFIYFGAGVCMAILVLYLPKARLTIPGNMRWSSPGGWFRIAALMTMLFLMIQILRSRFQTHPLDYSYADMLPIIRVMNQRFLEGHWRQVYDPIPEIWGGVRPIYLPAMWLPFSVSLLLPMDMRWIGALAVFLSMGVFIFTVPLSRKKIAGILVFLLGLLLLWWIGTEEISNFFSMTEEGVVAAYYVFLVLAILSGRIFWITLAASLCLFSRYALAGWIPAFILYLILTKKRKEALFFCLGTLAFACIFFILPFGWSAFARSAKLPAGYIAFSGKVWQDSPEFFFQGPGFARFFGPGRIALQHGLLILLSFGVPLIFILIAWTRERSRKLANLPLASLKISLVIFYNFLDVPYVYLMYTSSFVSLMMLASVLRGEPMASSRAIA